MRKLKLVVLGVAMIAMSCEKDETKNQQPEGDTSSILSKEYILENDVEGIRETGILEGDIFISNNHLKELEKNGASPHSKLRIANSRVNMCKSPRQRNGKKRIDINIDRVNTRTQQAVRRAASLLNSLNLGLAFKPITGSPGAAGSRITFFARDLQVGIGVGTFPRNGNVGHTITMDRNFTRTATETALTNVIIHEMGHNLGFRHSDWNGRISCPAGPRGSRGVENVANTFFVFPSDPSNGTNTNSVMVACGDVEQRMTNRDRNAFRRAYPIARARACR